MGWVCVGGLALLHTLSFLFCENKRLINSKMRCHYITNVTMASIDLAGAYMPKQKISVFKAGHLLDHASTKIPNITGRIVEVKKSRQRAGDNNTEFKYIKNKLT